MAAVLWLTGCASASTPALKVKGIEADFVPGTIIDTRTGSAVTEDELIQTLRSVSVVYVGEQHTSKVHHGIQLQVIEQLAAVNPALKVGMEMFSRPYQAKLDRWSNGDMAIDEFLRQVHWYANWRYNHRLYQDILLFVQEHHLDLVALNIAFHIPPKIAIGGTDSLSDAEKAQLPDRIDTTNADHRAYVKEVFDHHRVHGRNDFENFYAAQCTWEDIMAQSIAEHLAPGDQMVVVIGNGHIVRKFGVPQRAWQRTKADYKTVYLATEGTTVSRQDADFIWLTPASK